jgi:hypothetical protein
VDTRRSARVAIALLVAGTGLVAFPVAAGGATREPFAAAFGRAHARATPFGAETRPDAFPPRAMTRGAAGRPASGADEFQIFSTYYGPAETASVASTLRSLDHGPEMAGLSVYVAAPGEVREACGAGVIACYVPSESKMVVSGVDRPVAGVPRAFAIAHEYGHHIANSEAAGTFPAIEAGTIRWATYERVCQLTRAHRLFPGEQGVHYWRDPEEAFAESYAHLSDPAARVTWQYTPLLEPTPTSLAKIRADVVDPWTGPITYPWSGSLSGPRPVASRAVRTPLDGPVSASLQASPGAALGLVLRDSGGGRVFARATTNPTGEASLTYSNCGHDSLRLEVHAQTPTPFQASITRP